jgi:nucleotidyltransferase/DNA polymerase involved in DNA repair
MDAFFAAIEQRDNRKLIGKPVIIGADPQKGRGRGVVSTCSYEARVFGIHSAMPISEAYRKCPHGTFIIPDMNKYSHESQLIHNIFQLFTPDVEQVGIDEAYLDITGTHHFFKTPIDACRALKKAIKKDRNLTASIGLAPNKMVAKIASDLNKPDGLLQVRKEDVYTFLGPLKIQKVSGIGKKTVQLLNANKIFTIQDLHKYTQNQLCTMYGSLGSYLWQISQGIGNEKIELSDQCKSISNEYTFETDVNDDLFILKTISLLSEKVSRRLRIQKLKGKTISLKIRLTCFSTYTRSVTLPNSTNYVEDIYSALYNLYTKFDRNAKKVRLVGVKVTNLQETSRQSDLFNFASDIKREKIYSALDKIKDKFGSNSIHHADQLFN